MIHKRCVGSFVAAAFLSVAPAARAAGHGPVFGATTPTLGRGGWSLDQAWTMRLGDAAASEQMLKTMVSFGITEDLQVSGSVPIVMRTGEMAMTRMMSMMSGSRDLEGLLAYRFQRRPIGIGGRQESTVYAGASAPLDATRAGMRAGPSLYVGGATGYASRAHYFWVGGGVQHFAERQGDQTGDSRVVSVVYGYRPRPLRVEAEKPDLRFFIEAAAEDRNAGRHGGMVMPTGARTAFVGPTTLLLYKQYGIEGGILFPAYQRVDAGRARERFRVAVNFSYFFWLK
jgi:hypothetical protein